MVAREDVLVAMATSGTSMNVAMAARVMAMHVVMAARGTACSHGNKREGHVVTAAKGTLLWSLSVG